ncbi:MAG: hypothetical protein CMJ25_21595 [Phycisphaerae bacterium]|nr:hypothetical protein [Phycisphaerae bacterium]
MKPRKTTYLAHRWIGLIISMQLLAWSVGGFIFSVLDIDAVHGDHESRIHQPSGFSPSMFPIEIQNVLLEQGVDSISTALLIDRGLGPFWEINSSDGGWFGRVDQEGNIAGRITAEQAQRIASDDFIHEADISSIILIENNPPSEYRGGKIPAYQVTMDHPKETHIYIDAATGRIMARRNKSWRVFDFFWMLHTMDYKGRDNFNHPLLTIASVLAITTSSSGLALWGWRIIPKFRRKLMGNKRSYS